MKFIIISILITAVVAEKRNFGGYSVYKLTPKSEDDVTVLKQLQKDGIGEFWDDTFFLNFEMRIMVPDVNKNKFYDAVNNAGIETTVVIKDLQRAIDDQLKPTQRSAGESFLSMNWNQYYSLDEINGWLDEVERNYPNIVTPVTIGYSVENRPIRGIILNYRPNRNDTIVGMMQGTLHAREWITTATMTWIIKELLTSTDPEIRALAENIEWHLFPIVNPDGYEYTFTSNRMWRKNRSTLNFTSCQASGMPDDASNGVDLNRNFDFLWMTVGASDNPCTNLFGGPSPASEPETRAISQYVLSLNSRGRFLYFFDFHSYTQLVIVPFSHLNSSEVLLADNFADMFEVAVRGADRLERRYGTPYRVGISADILYLMSGTAFDWVKHATDVPISYLIELRDLGEYGFLLPPEQIVPNSIEIMDALVEMDRTTRKLGYYSHSGTQSTVSAFGIVLFGAMLALIY